MLPILKSVLHELPELLQRKDWNSLHITYEPPEVLRLWRSWGDYRIFLHEILPPFPRRKALYHPHPWPSIVLLLDGSYRMGVGYGPGLEEPPQTMTVRVSAGDWYEMADRDGWHIVEPEETSFSIMVTGKPWGREMPRSEHPPQLPLEPARAHALQQKFVQFLSPGPKTWAHLL